MSDSSVNVPVNGDDSARLHLDYTAPDQRRGNARQEWREGALSAVATATSPYRSRINAAAATANRLLQIDKRVLVLGRRPAIVSSPRDGRSAAASIPEHANGMVLGQKCRPGNGLP